MRLAVGRKSELMPISTLSRANIYTLLKLADGLTSPTPRTRSGS